VWDYKRADFQLMKQKITAENWEILIQNERDMNIAEKNFLFVNQNVWAY
jgi:hypothetical protein